jgi:hypothetical protein
MKRDAMDFLIIPERSCLMYNKAIYRVQIEITAISWKSEIKNFHKKLNFGQ